jgi:hypothetical protein
MQIDMLNNTDGLTMLALGGFAAVVVVSLGVFGFLLFRGDKPRKT